MVSADLLDTTTITPPVYARRQPNIQVELGATRVQPRRSAWPKDTLLTKAGTTNILHWMNSIPESGALILNADDWGRDRETTDRTLECFQRGAVSSVSAMVFMSDSERAAGMALANTVDSGLHLNLTSPFTGPHISPGLSEHQNKLTAFLRTNRFAQVLYHPGLVSSFDYVVAAQRDEYRRLYGVEPGRVDGHHHMHLCSNILLTKLLPEGITVRRSFSFMPGEKNALNRAYRRMVDRRLARNHRLADFLFSLPPLDPPQRLKRIFSLAAGSAVEVETHPINRDEYHFLTTGEIFRVAGNIPVAPRYALQAART